MTCTPRTPVEELKGIGPAFAAQLRERGIARAGDLLLHFPASYIDLSHPAEAVAPGEARLFRFIPRRSRVSRNFHRRTALLRVEGRIGGVEVALVFFNQAYLGAAIAGRTELLVHGVVEERQGSWQMINPFVAPADAAGGVLSRYRPLGAIKGGTLRKVIAAALADWRDEDEPLPAALRRRHAFPPQAEALRAIHLPRTLAEAAGGRLRERFVYTEFLLFQLELQSLRGAFAGRRRVHRYRIDETLRRAVAERLPFRLSPEQEEAYAAIVNDLRAGRPMQRLLQGEVGSGKTIVAFLALLVARESGLQGAFLAPTEILARQHYENACAFFGAGSVALLTGGSDANERRRVLAGLADGSLPLVFGTHALIGAGVAFRRLAMVVIDEQHRFGVAQRAALFFKGRGADLLVTTATPIPRTMLLALYSDVDVSFLRTPLAGRQPVVTRVVPAAGRERFFRRLGVELGRGRKGYVILPLIERSEHAPELRALDEEARANRERFPGVPQAVLSGRSRPQEKRRVLQRFASGAVRLLLATTVVEVGIDVADATFMVIENADRYGLAQLHQLRGRVGRGSERSYCFLVESPRPSADGRERLRAIAASHDGFAIAEMDLELRGGGVIAGLEQSGEVEFRLADPQRDARMLQEAQVDARRLLEHPELQTPWLREFLAGLRKKIGNVSFS